MKGFHGDNCATVGVGTIDAASQRLMDATQVCKTLFATILILQK